MIFHCCGIVVYYLYVCILYVYILRLCVTVMLRPSYGLQQAIPYYAILSHTELLYVAPRLCCTVLQLLIAGASVCGLHRHQQFFLSVTII